MLPHHPLTASYRHLKPTHRHLKLPCRPLIHPATFLHTLSPFNDLSSPFRASPLPFSVPPIAFSSLSASSLPYNTWMVLYRLPVAFWPFKTTPLQSNPSPLLSNGSNAFWCHLTHPHRPLMLYRRPLACIHHPLTLLYTPVTPSHRHLTLSTSLPPINTHRGHLVPRRRPLTPPYFTLTLSCRPLNPSSLLFKAPPLLFNSCL